MTTVSNCANLWVCSEHWLPNYCLGMLISRKVTEVSEISHVNLKAGWKELTKPRNRSNSSLVQDQWLQDNHLRSGQRVPRRSQTRNTLYLGKCLSVCNIACSIIYYSIAFLPARIAAN